MNTHIKIESTPNIKGNTAVCLRMLRIAVFPFRNPLDYILFDILINLLFKIVIKLIQLKLSKDGWKSPLMQEIEYSYSNKLVSRIS